VHLRSITLKGFKSFPDRTRLDFTPGVSVVVGPNGSGKSNVTDAVLWAMGEQSPLAVRGQSMQDVIFGGGHGVQARSAAEVEIVLDNSDGQVDLPMGEISIMRRLDRNGEGEYRLNGARCRLVDVLEVLSDTGLGKEMHSVVSQGRVESIVTSKPKERRLLIEEAAGLGKHRKRRRRAQLKLDRTQENLDRALDVEREARSRLRPLKRQAEAAELHERLERQMLEAQWELARDDVRARRAELEGLQAAALAARKARGEAEQALAEVAAKRELAERALAERTERREAIARRVERARTAGERIELRLERTRESAEAIAERLERRRARLTLLEAQREADAPDEAGRERVEALEAEIARLDGEREQQLERELKALTEERERAAERAAELVAGAEQHAAALEAAEQACEIARSALRAAEHSAESARREAARVGAELASANQYLRTQSGAPTGERALADDLEVEPGFELAVAAALGARLRAAVVPDRRQGAELLERLGADGGRALVTGGSPATAAQPGAEPSPGALRLAELVRGPDATLALARRLLENVWVVDELDALAESFTGVAVTRDGVAWDARAAELRRAPRGAEDRVLVERNRRDSLVAESELAARAEHGALAAVETAAQAVAAADATREEADRARREAGRACAEAQEAERRAAWLIDERRAAPDQGAGAVRRAQLQGELAAEQRVARRAAEERAQRAAAIERLTGQIARDEQLGPVAAGLEAVLVTAHAAVDERATLLQAELEEDRRAGEGVAAELRACAAGEAEIQTRLRDCGEQVTAAEVRAQQARDQEGEATQTLSALATRLGLEPEPAAEPLDPEQAQALRARIERLLRRREQIGAVNPLAKQEYEEAIAHVEELERHRTDLETALRELRALIRDTDRQIRVTFEETFAAAAKNFEELSAQLFPGGRGRLRLVREDSGPRAVLGGADADDEGARLAAEEAAAEAEADKELGEPEDDLGVEIEITPAGKSMKRLTLLSGGEKSLTAIAFIFSVFLARPCPFYILDEVEAALDDLNISRFLDLLRAYRDRAQFIVVTHQKRTMEAADTLYGVSMGGDGVSKVVSRRLPQLVEAGAESAVA
jgi:chromosome segregation protein